MKISFVSINNFFKINIDKLNFVSTFGTAKNK
jgi:hypothetical protein